MKFNFLLAFLLSTLRSNAHVDEYVAPNVPFSAIIKLPFIPADKKISYGDSALQYGLLWRGAKTVGVNNTPLVVLIHGGCWLNAFGVDHTKPMASAIAAAGFDVWALEYRRTGDEGGGWPGSFEDIQKALSFITGLPKGINKNEVVLVGHSAGGHLALLAHAKAGGGSPKIIKTIGLAAITDMVNYVTGKNNCQTAGLQFMNGTATDKPDNYQAANPQQYSPFADALLLYGQADTIVPESQADLNGAETIKLESAGHFDWLHPSSEAFNLLLQQLKLGKIHPEMQTERK